jgi:DNA-binding Lrp family transcriptional regulator
MKKIDWRLLSELMKNSKTSDRELARKIGVSQPTVTRRRRNLEKQGIIKEYTVIPDFLKLGYRIIAVTLFKYERRFDKETTEKAKKILGGVLKKSGIIMADRGMGAGCNAVMISVHRDYNSFRKFTDWAQQLVSLGQVEIDSFLIDLADEVHYLPLTFSSLAEYILTQKKE